MTKTKVILLVCFLLTFGAGVSVGLLTGRPEHRRGPGGMLEKELNLTPAQKEQMKAIWDDAMKSQRPQEGQRRESLSQERNQKIAALLSETQRAEYDAIQKDFSRKMEELNQERKQSFEKAVEQTKKILTPEQARKYEDMMKRPRERDGGGPGESFGPRRPHGGPGSRPTSRPASGPVNVETSTSQGER